MRKAGSANQVSHRCKLAVVLWAEKDTCGVSRKRRLWCEQERTPVVLWAEKDTCGVSITEGGVQEDIP